MGCVFCASGLNGVARNLTAGEILEQLVRLRNLPPPDGRLTHIVVMGMGEPLANLDNLLAALDVAGHKDGLGIGARHVTISTVGLPAKIRRLADLGKQYHLAVSLHAPNDLLRTQIVPTNDKTGLAAILAAADYFFETTGRQVTYEYVLLGGLNDGPRDARELASLPAGPQGARQPDPVQRRDGSAVPPADAGGAGGVRRHSAPGRHQREGPQAQGVGDRRGVRAAPPQRRAGARVGRRLVARRRHGRL